MDRNADLDAALRFVIGRIEEQATLSGEPLNKEENLLVRYLPSSDATTYPDPEFPMPVPRNVNLERLCALGKAAYLNDHHASPTSLDWEFACAVFRLNRHPMWGLLQQAGVKYRRPRWDGILLVTSSLLFVGAGLWLALVVGESYEPWGRLQWIAYGSGYGAVIVLTYFASRRIEKRQLKTEIERCRGRCRLARIAAG